MFPSLGFFVFAFHSMTHFVNVYSEQGMAVVIHLSIKITLHSHQHYVHIHNNPFCNSQDQELPRRSLTNNLWNMHTMEILTTLQWKETNYWYMWQPGWVSRELGWVKKKPIPKGYLLYNSIYITFSKWQNYRKGEWISGCQMLRRKCVGEKQVCL